MYIYIGNVTSLLVSYFTLCPHWSVKYSSLNQNIIQISAYPGPHVAHLKPQNSSQTDSTTLLATLHYKLWMTLMKRPHQHRSVNWLNQTIICSITFCHKSHSTWRWVWLYWVVWNSFDSFNSAADPRSTAVGPPSAHRRLAALDFLLQAGICNTHTHTHCGNPVTESLVLTVSITHRSPK